MTPKEARSRCAALAEQLDDPTSSPAHQELIKLADNTTRALDDAFPRRARFCAILQARSSEARALHVLPDAPGEGLRATWSELSNALRIAESIFASELDRS